jgi:hypothetical protein
MRTTTCRYSQLDPDTQEYLRGVHKSNGKRCPGVYMEGDPNPWGKAAIGTGPVFVLVGIIWAFNSNKDAYAAAMLLAGFCLLGGWLTWYGLRELMAGSGKRFHGNFVYCDPTHVYQVAGDEVAITDVAAFQKVVAKPNGLHFTLEDGKFFVPVQRAVRAELVERYYNAILDLEESDDPKWAKLDTADLGGVAKHIAVEGGFPISKDSANLKVDFVPEQPRNEGGGGPPLRLLVAFGCAAIVFLFGALVFKPMRDSGNFAAAKEGGAPGLRGYLMDERNTANRGEAKKLLAAFYDAPIAKVKAGVPDPHAPARDAIVAILESLREAPQPVVSIQVIEQGELDGRDARQTQLRTELADAMGLYVGQVLIAFVKNPDDKKAHFEITYAPQANGEVTWKIGFRAKIDEPAVEIAEQKLGPTAPAAIPQSIKNAIFQTVFNTTAPVLPPPPPPEWD